MRIMLLALISFGLACSDSNPSPTPGGGNPPAPSPSNTDDAAPPPPPAVVVNGCETFVDMTANGGALNGPMNAAPAQFSPNCVHVKVGQSVTWNVDFAAHPLAASGGDTPSPIAETVSGTSMRFTFSKAGTFGYHCLAHPSIMFGAVLVTP